VYGGLTGSKVAEGQQVDIKSEIASGQADLYFEIRHFSDPIDPKKWFETKRGS
jgi:septal ring factor EnvC (AmiA/AmiB activator)